MKNKEKKQDRISSKLFKGQKIKNNEKKKIMSLRNKANAFVITGDFISTRKAVECIKN